MGVFHVFEFVHMVLIRVKHLVCSKWTVRIPDYSKAFPVSLLSTMNSFSIFDQHFITDLNHLGILSEISNVYSKFEFKPDTEI